MYIFVINILPCLFFSNEKLFETSTHSFVLGADPYHTSKHYKRNSLYFLWNLSCFISILYIKLFVFLFVFFFFGLVLRVLTSWHNDLASSG